MKIAELTENFYAQKALTNLTHAVTSGNSVQEGRPAGSAPVDLDGVPSGVLIRCGDVAEILTQNNETAQAYFLGGLLDGLCSYREGNSET